MAKRRSHGEGAVYWDTSRDRWVGQVWLDGRRRKVSAKTKAEATAKLGKLQHGDEAERHADRRMTLASLLTEWTDKGLAVRDIAPGTREVHRWAVDIWTDELGKVKLTDLDVPRIEKVLGRLASRDEHPLSKSSLTKLRATLRQAMKWAQRRRIIAWDPAAAAELPVSAAETRPRRALTTDELAALGRALDGHPMAALLALMARLGLRPGEAAGVCGDALNLDGDPPTVAVLRGVRLEKGRPRLVDDLKTIGARRTLAMPPDLADLLRRHVEAVEPGDGRLFSDGNGGPVHPSTVRAELVHACEAAGVPVVTPNELRHSAATALANAGLPPHHVADILGHRSTRMVDAVYRHRPAVIEGAESAAGPAWSS